MGVLSFCPSYAAAAAATNACTAASVGASVGGTTALVAAGAAGGFVGGYIASGGDFRAALIGGLSGGVAGLIGASITDPIGRVLAHGVNNGVASRLQGGKFFHGFISGSLVKSISGRIHGLFKNNPIGGAIAAAVVGGTASHLMGGDATNGAATAAFAYLFNEATTANPGMGIEWKAIRSFLGKVVGGSLAVLGSLVTLDETIRENAYLSHYTTAERAELIKETGMVIPSQDGYTYLTPDYYPDGKIAQAQLALSVKPNIRIDIPIANMPPVRTEIGIVQPTDTQPGGGTEIKVPAPVPVTHARYYRIE